MNPVTGPFTTTVNKTGAQMGAPGGSVNNSNIWYRRTRVSYRQRKPYNLVLPFDFSEASVSNVTLTGDNPDRNSLHISIGNGFLPLSPDYTDSAYVKAWNAFKSAVHDSAQIGLALMESRKSMDMVTARCLTMARFALELRRGNFRRAARALGLNRPPPKKRLSSKKTAKAFGDNFLEFHFGWAPLVNDIDQAIKILGKQNVYQKTVESRKGSTFSGKDVSVKELSTLVTTTTEWSGRVSYELSGVVTIVNDNALLAESLGLNNPLLLVYESIPFSFIANWFFSIEEFLSSFSAFSGLNLTNTRTTMHVKSTTTYSEHRAHWLYGPSGIGISGTIKGVAVSRSNAAIAGPKLVLRSPWTLSPSRGLTAVSLLVQRLR